jgi:membrane-associated phospholipid phosphatase
MAMTQALLYGALPCLPIRIDKHCDKGRNFKTNARWQCRSLIPLFGSKHALDVQTSNAIHPPSLISRAAISSAAGRQHLGLALSQNEATAVFTGAAVGFTLLALDLRYLHLLQSLDLAVHTWVVNDSGLSAFQRQVIAGKLMSDAPIVLGWLVWAVAIASQPRSSKPYPASSLRRTLICGAIYVVGGGTVNGGDPFLVVALKNVFQRIRPSPNHSTFAFPSGHTTAATYIMGAALCVLLPMALQRFSEAQADVQGAEATERKRIERSLPAWWPLAWAACVGTTAAGRVLSDAHWLSDVAAGLCLGALLTATAVLLCHATDTFSQEV